MNTDTLQAIVLSVLLVIGLVWWLHPRTTKDEGQHTTGYTPTVDAYKSDEYSKRMNETGKHPGGCEDVLYNRSHDENGNFTDWY